MTAKHSNLIVKLQKMGFNVRPYKSLLLMNCRVNLALQCHGSGVQTTDSSCKRFSHIYECRKIHGKWERKSEQEVKTKLNRRVLSKLESKGFIERERIGRNTFLRVTDQGEIFALLELANGKNY